MSHIAQHISILLLALGLPLSIGAAEEPIVVIAHKGAKTAKLSRSELRPLFQTKRTTWGDGSSVVALNLPSSNAVRRGFDAAVLGLDPDRVARYWIDRKIRGGARAPKEIPSPALVVKVVSKKAGAVGYVGASQVDDSVKIIARVVNGEVVAP